MSFKTDKGRVIGLGSAKTGAQHWLSERLKSVALIPLTLAFICIIGPLIGADHATVVAKFQTPINAILIILFLFVTFKHLADGLQVVIEDYVHSKPAFVTLLLLSKFICWGFGVAGIFAVAKLAFTG